MADEITEHLQNLLALLEVMQVNAVLPWQAIAEGTESVIFCFATQNPIEQEGTYSLPEAQLDRFYVRYKFRLSFFFCVAEVVKQTTTNNNTIFRRF